MAEIVNRGRRTKISAMDHDKLRKEAPKIQFELPYSLFLSVCVTGRHVTRQLDKKLKKKKVSDAVRRGLVGRAAFDFINFLVAWLTDLTVVGQGAEAGYINYIEPILMLKLKEVEDKWVDLYTEQSQFYLQANEAAKLQAGARRPAGRNIPAPPGRGNKQQNKLVGMAATCKPFQVDDCNYGIKCKFRHRCWWCGKYGHGIKSCPDFLKKADLAPASRGKGRGK